METKELILHKLTEKFQTDIQEITDFRGDLSISVNKDRIIEICQFLKEDSELNFSLCKDVTAIDWATRKNRFTVVYHIYSFQLNYQLRLKANITGTAEEINSVTSIWPSANWYERETWDMYGIKFINHPDLRRMYMPEEFEYHPLRKEFPVMGIPGSIPLPEKAD
jgi:NADH-quinone oxidoreductase subunit C